MINNLYIKATPTTAAVTWGSITGTLSSQTDLQSALNAKQATLVSGTNIKTINGSSVLGSGDLTIGASASWGGITGTLSSQTDLQTALNAKQDTYGQEALSYSTDIPLGNLWFNYNNFSLITSDVTANFESVSTNTFKSYAYRWSKWAYFGWETISGTTWSTLTINNQNLIFYRFFPASGTGTITINSNRIGVFNNTIAGCTYNLPNCEAIYWNGLSITSILTFNANALKFIGGSFTIGANATISMTSLETIQGNLTFQGTPPTTFTNNSLLILSGGLNYTGANMTSITLDNLKILGSVNLSPGTGANLFTTFSFANIKEVLGNFTTNTTIGLSQASVDHILIRLAALDGTNGTTRYQNRTVTVRGAAPSAAGLTARATLIARGCTVTTS